MSPAVPVCWLVTGATGQLGTDLQALLAGEDVTAVGRSRLDLTDEAQVRSVVGGWRDDVLARGARPVLLNAAAYTAVDAAETDEDNAHRVNGLAPGWLAEELAGAGRLVHVSTDYVFAGDAASPYLIDDEPAPRTAYGRTKLTGERRVAAVGADATVVRTAWVHGRHGRNFVRTMVELERSRETVSVVADQIGSPTWSADLAAGLVELGRRDAPAPGVLHFVNTGEVSWHGLAQAVFEEVGADPARVRETTTADFPRPAPRPAYSVLDVSAWGGAGLRRPRPWRDALREALSGT